MSLLDLITGGSSERANEALDQALSDIGAVQSPTVQQLTLPQLEQYVNAGLMTPAQAQAYLQNNNAFATENTPQTGTDAQIQALNQLAGVANAGAAGTPIEQAQQAQAIEAMNQAVGGQRGAIEQQAEARGAPGALVQAALENQTVGQDAQQAYLNSLQSQSGAYQAALNAMAGQGALGSQLQGQQNTQANTVAAAQNAMQQFNAANQQNVSAQNAGLKQQANAYNAQNAQNVANQNTQTGNERTMYNAQLPETVFSNQMQKANAQAGVNEARAENATKQGQQNAALFGGILGAGATLGGNYLMGAGLGNAIGGAGSAAPAGMFNANSSLNLYQPNSMGLPQYAEGGIVPSHEFCYHDGGICMEKGGMVPGKAEVPGDSLKNDKMHIMASPGEAVIPRTVVNQHRPEVLSLLAGHHEQSTPSVHPEDVVSVLSALTRMRHNPAV